MRTIVWMQVVDSVDDVFRILLAHKPDEINRLPGDDSVNLVNAPLMARAINSHHRSRAMAHKSNATTLPPAIWTRARVKPNPSPERLRTPMTIPTAPPIITMSITVVPVALTASNSNAKDRRVPL